jgi:3-phenylpropionate/cinnamic acid dioxygenase small subunit
VGLNLEYQYRVQDINARYTEAIDEDHLESWPDFFRPDGKYLINTAENVAQNLPLGLMFATSQAMLRDRIKALRQANVYEAQRYRHVLGAPIILGDAGGIVMARTSFVVARIMHGGETMLFATGVYEDRVALDGDSTLFAEKKVIIDSRQIDTLLAIPL